PLVNQEDVTLTSQIGVRLAQETRIAGGRRDSPAGEEDQGVRGDSRTLGRKDDDLEPDLSPYAGGTVLKDLVAAAADLLVQARHARHGASFPAVPGPGACAFEAPASTPRSIAATRPLRFVSMPGITEADSGRLHRCPRCPTAGCQVSRSRARL